MDMNIQTRNLFTPSTKLLKNLHSMIQHGIPNKPPTRQSFTAVLHISEAAGKPILRILGITTGLLMTRTFAFSKRKVCDQKHRSKKMTRIISRGTSHPNRESTSQPWVSAPGGTHQDTLPTLPRSTPISYEEEADDRTPHQRYAWLLSARGPGYALTKPSPLHSESTGEEHIIDIGDVGVYSDDKAFLALFNITKPRGGLAEEDQAPEGIDPPCDIQKAVDNDPNHFQEEEPLIRPRGSISRQWAHDENGSRVFTFNLSAKEGALLMLPRGGIRLRQLNLTKRKEFMKCIQDHWHRWYRFADQYSFAYKKGDTLCLLTGVERCSVWAMAVWDSMSGYDCGGRSSLELDVNKSSGRCSWRFPPARCSMHAAAPKPSVGTENKLTETVFIRAFWISRSSGGIDSRPLPEHCGGEYLRRPEGRSCAELSQDLSDTSFPGGEDGREADQEQDPGGHGWQSRNPWNPFYARRDPGGSSFDTSPYPPAGGSSSLNPPYQSHQRQPATSHWQSSGPVESQYGPADLQDETPTRESDALNLSSHDFDSIDHPCRVIDKFALKLVAKARPNLLDSGCVAISHDDDWMSILEDSDDVLPKGTEVLRRICDKFKFVVEKGKPN
ncbi:hypothetical protein V5O48_016480 [Marasmius crinis-equi]|uniref:Uncharacterized protein n=1 Tax=Marasmius crinis-equi TaxID=585013 RepID=A0ABR3ERN6_9AGAR